MNECLICKSNHLKASKAAISPFIMEYVLENSQLNTSEQILFMKCKECNFMFYNSRFDDNEMKNLYSNYRDENYQKIRQKYELSYTRKFNLALGQDPTEIRNRKRNLSNLLKKYVDIRKIKTVLDFGGGSGQFIPTEFFECNKFVYEVSNNTQAVNGTSIIHDLNKIKNSSFDFIMCAHVLEHLPNPVKELSLLKEFSHEKTVFYLEVPEDHPAITWKKIIKRILPKTVKKTIGISTEDNVLLHEHINHFTTTSMKALLKTASLTVMCIQRKKINCGYSKVSIISVLAVHSKSI